MGETQPPTPGARSCSGSPPLRVPSAAAGRAQHSSLQKQGTQVRGNQGNGPNVWTSPQSHTSSRGSWTPGAVEGETCLHGWWGHVGEVAAVQTLLSADRTRAREEPAGRHAVCGAAGHIPRKSGITGGTVVQVAAALDLFPQLSSAEWSDQRIVTPGLSSNGPTSLGVNSTSWERSG